MTSKKSSFNFILMKHEFSDQIIFTGIYLAVLVLPLLLFSDIQLPFKLFDINSVIQLSFYVATTLLPLVLAINQFRYVFKKDWATQVHSLPFTRKSMFCSKVLSGLIVLTLPLMFFMVTNLITGSFNISVAPMAYMALLILVAVAMYLMMVVVILVSGNLYKSLGVLLLVNLLPHLLVTIVLKNLDLSWKGFYLNHDWLIQLVFKSSPVTALLNPVTSDLIWFQIFVISIFACLSYGVGYFAYVTRRDESYLMPYGLKIFLEIALVIMSTLTIGMYWLSYRESIGGGYILGALVGGIIAQRMFYSRWGFKHKKWFLILGFAIACHLFFAVDITGFEKRMPPINEVASVKFSSVYQEESNFYTSRDIIETVEEIHGQILNQKPFGDENDPIIIEYVLNNGVHMKRQYMINKYRYKNELSRMITSPDYKVFKYGDFYLEGRDVYEIVINSYQYWGEPLIITESKEIDALMTALRTDMSQADADDLEFKSFDFGDITINGGEALPLKLCFKETIKTFESMGYDTQIVANVDGISGVRMERSESDILIPDVILVEDEAFYPLILECLVDGAYVGEDNEVYYTVGIFLKDRMDLIVFGYIREEDLSDAFRDQYLH